MSIATRANRYGSSFHRTGKVAASAPAADEVATRTTEDVAVPPVVLAATQLSHEAGATIQVLLNPILHENSRLIDRVRSLEVEIGHLRERIRQLEAQGVPGPALAQRVPTGIYRMAVGAIDSASPPCHHD